MEISKIEYVGNLRTKAVHLKSENGIITDAPTDNHGKGEAFSPTDLLSTSLGSCMLTIMGIKAGKNNIPFNSASASIGKVMAANPRRVAEIHVTIDMPAENYSNEQKHLLEDAALNCPVAKSLHPDLLQKVTFNYN